MFVPGAVHVTQTETSAADLHCDMPLNTNVTSTAVTSPEYVMPVCNISLNLAPGCGDRWPGELYDRTASRVGSSADSFSCVSRWRLRPDGRGKVPGQLVVPCFCAAASLKQPQAPVRALRLLSNSLGRHYSCTLMSFGRGRWSPDLISTAIPDIRCADDTGRLSDQQ